MRQLHELEYLTTKEAAEYCRVSLSQFLVSTRLAPAQRRRKEIRLTKAGTAYIERLVAATRARRLDSVPAKSPPPSE